MKTKNANIFCLLFISVLFINACKTLPVENKTNIVSNSETFTVQLLGMNDFHGQVTDLSTHKTFGQHGGMVQLARHLLHSVDATNEQSFILHAGDHVGASPAESALLQDEPAIDFLNLMNHYCQSLHQNQCHIIGAAGNHEFDEGSDEMLRLLNGGNHSKGPFIHNQWQGANYVTLGANVIDNATGAPLLPPYVVHEVNGVNIGFIGITLDITPQLVVPGIVDNLTFKDQAAIVNKYAKELQKKGVEAIVVVVHDGSAGIYVHQGNAQEYYQGETKAQSTINMDSHFGRFIQEVSSAVDVLVTGHSHRFTNAYVNNKEGKTFLVTQAFSSGRAYSDISITLDKSSKDIVQASAQVMLTRANSDLHLSPQASATLDKIKQLKVASKAFAKGVTSEVIGEYKAIANEIPLGTFIANSHKAALQTDMAIMNRGGVRSTLSEGQVTWGKLFAIQPFSNALIVREYSGRQLSSLIDSRQFWSSDVSINNNGQVFFRGKPLQAEKTYTVAGNAYILNSERFNKGTLKSIHGLDIDATIDYIKGLKQPFFLK